MATKKEVSKVIKLSAIRSFTAFVAVTDLGSILLGYNKLVKVKSINVYTEQARGVSAVLTFLDVNGNPILSNPVKTDQFQTNSSGLVIHSGGGQGPISFINLLIGGVRIDSVSTSSTFGPSAIFIILEVLEEYIEENIS